MVLRFSDDLQYSSMVVVNSISESLWPCQHTHADVSFSLWSHRCRQPGPKWLPAGFLSASRNYHRPSGPKWLPADLMRFSRSYLCQPGSKWLRTNLVRAYRMCFRTHNALYSRQLPSRLTITSSRPPENQDLFQAT